MSRTSHVRSSRRAETSIVRIIAVAACALPLLGPSHAAAQGDTQQLAKKLFGSGVEYYDKGDYARALQAFQEAYRLRPHPVVRVNMANCYDRMGKPIEAIFHFERFLEENQEGVKAAQRKEVMAALKRLRKRVGQVRLYVVPDGVSISIDDAEQRKSPVVEPVLLEAGEHFIDAQLQGYRPVRRSVNVAGGDVTEISITMQTLPESSAAAAVPALPAHATPEPAAAKGQSTQPPVEELAEEPVREPAQPEPEPYERPVVRDSLGKGTPVLIAGAATALLGIATAVTGVMALGADADYDYLSGKSALSEQERTDAENTAARAEDLALATDVLLGMTLAGAAVTTYFLLTGEREPASGSTTASAWVGPGSGGIALSGAL